MWKTLETMVNAAPISDAARKKLLLLISSYRSRENEIKSHCADGVCTIVIGGQPGLKARRREITRMVIENLFNPEMLVENLRGLVKPEVFKRVERLLRLEIRNALDKVVENRQKFATEFSKYAAENSLRFLTISQTLIWSYINTFIAPVEKELQKLIEAINKDRKVKEKKKEDDFPDQRAV
ncbi:hypothetical protein HY570_00980 [Candidatus Micrarchaeota archaeon]|nr:hypothetical protein [Candidatus Micrarchaeota archaeon]